MLDIDHSIELPAGEDRRHQLPPHLERMPPGPELLAFVSAVDRSKLNGHDLVRLIKARDRLIAHQQAEQNSDMVEMAHSAPSSADSLPERKQEAHEYASDEIRAALRLTRRSAETRLGFAMDLQERFPRVNEMLRSGKIDTPRARTIVSGVSHVSDRAAGRILDIILDSAPSLTTSQLAKRIRKLCAEVEPQEAHERYVDAIAERRVVFEQSWDLSAEFHAYGIPIERASSIGRRINGFARSLRSSGDERTIDQIRVDVLLDLLEGNDLGAAGGTVDIKVDLTTLMGLDDRAGEIPGWGPVIADMAKKTALAQQKVSWSFQVRDENGDIVAADVTRRRPSAAQKRMVHAMSPTCSFPGCVVPASDCDIDHINPWAKGGLTTVANSDPKCDHDHQLRDHGWEYQKVEGRHLWTSPLGHIYVKERDPP